MGLNIYEIEIQAKAQKLLDAEVLKYNDAVTVFDNTVTALNSLGDPYETEEGVDLLKTLFKTIEELDLISRRIGEYKAIVDYYTTKDLLI